MRYFEKAAEVSPRALSELESPKRRFISSTGVGSTCQTPDRFRACHGTREGLERRGSVCHRACGEFLAWGNEPLSGRVTRAAATAIRMKADLLGHYPDFSHTPGRAPRHIIYTRRCECSNRSFSRKLKSPSWSTVGRLSSNTRPFDGSSNGGWQIACIRTGIAVTEFITTIRAIRRLRSIASTSAFQWSMTFHPIRTAW